jgi:hypothetical protein
MKIFILSVLLLVVTSFTTVTLAAIPSSKGLVIETIKEYKFLHLSKVIKTDSLKIDPRQSELSNIITQESNAILHIDPGRQEWGFNNKLVNTDKTPILHIDPGRQK